MQRPDTARLTWGSATVVLATVALLLLSGTTTTPGIAAACAAGLLLGVLVAVTMPVRAGRVKTSGAVPPDPGNEEVRAAVPRVRAGTGTRTGS
ncbi:hypothetical protein [Streptomyces sp. NPDC001744]|uniref:hypothetical protein n=1 Tax=Streptomyces sp. NPDC001744 TaxID=3364606 RepID=UPI0036B46535